MKLPQTTDEVLIDIRKRFSYERKNIGVGFDNCGWYAYYDGIVTCNFMDDTFNTSYDAAFALWKYFNDHLWHLEIDND